MRIKRKLFTLIVIMVLILSISASAQLPVKEEEESVLAKGINWILDTLFFKSPVANSGSTESVEDAGAAAAAPDPLAQVADALKEGEHFVSNAKDLTFKGFVYDESSKKWKVLSEYNDEKGDKHLVTYDRAYGSGEREKKKGVGGPFPVYKEISPGSTIMLNENKQYAKLTEDGATEAAPAPGVPALSSANIETTAALPIFDYVSPPVLPTLNDAQKKNAAAINTEKTNELNRILADAKKDGIDCFGFTGGLACTKPGSPPDVYVKDPELLQKVYLYEQRLLALSNSWESEYSAAGLSGEALPEYPGIPKSDIGRLSPVPVTVGEERKTTDAKEITIKTQQGVVAPTVELSSTQKSILGLTGLTNTEIDNLLRGEVIIQEHQTVFAGTDGRVYRLVGDEMFVMEAGDTTASGYAWYPVSKAQFQQQLENARNRKLSPPAIAQVPQVPVGLVLTADGKVAKPQWCTNGCKYDEKSDTWTDTDPRTGISRTLSQEEGILTKIEWRCVNNICGYAEVEFYMNANGEIVGPTGKVRRLKADDPKIKAYAGESKPCPGNKKGCDGDYNKDGVIDDFDKRAKRVDLMIDRYNPFSSFGISWSSTIGGGIFSLALDDKGVMGLFEEKVMEDMMYWTRGSQTFIDEICESKGFEEEPENGGATIALATREGRSYAHIEASRYKMGTEIPEDEDEEKDQYMYKFTWALEAAECDIPFTVCAYLQGSNDCVPLYGMDAIGNYNWVELEPPASDGSFDENDPPYEKITGPGMIAFYSTKDIDLLCIHFRESPSCLSIDGRKELCNSIEDITIAESDVFDFIDRPTVTIAEGVRAGVVETSGRPTIDLSALI